MDTRLEGAWEQPTVMVRHRNRLSGLIWGICLWGGIAPVPALASEPSPLLGVWEKVSTYLTKEAWLELKNLPLPQDTIGQREHNFCTAVVMLDQQPLREDRLDEVELRLKTLLSAEMNDEIDGASRYLLGRIAQIYRATPNVTLAADYYRELIQREGPGHWANIARLKIAVLILYALPAVNINDRIDQTEALIPAATDALVVRDLHRLVGRAMMFYNMSPAVALRHLLAADEIGGLTGTLGADQLVQIGELAWDTGDEELAIKYYQRLRNEYPRDPRYFLMDQRIAGNPVPKRSERLHGR